MGTRTDNASGFVGPHDDEDDEDDEGDAPFGIDWPYWIDGHPSCLDCTFVHVQEQLCANCYMPVSEGQVICDSCSRVL
jgi:hypothetical protein